MRLCECGCGGTIVPKPKHKYRQPRFINGHRSTGHTRYHPRRQEIPSGRCECGCGGNTSIAKYTERALRYFRGHPVPFLPGHSAKRRGPLSHKWKGGRFIHSTSGYVYVYAPDHPRANARGYVFEHRLVMERALGRILGPDEDVHHVNQKRDDNREENLRVMTKAEHCREHAGKLVRARAIAAAKRTQHP